MFDNSVNYGLEYLSRNTKKKSTNRNIIRLRIFSVIFEQTFQRFEFVILSQYDDYNYKVQLSKNLNYFLFIFY